MKKTILSGLFISSVFVVSAMVHMPAQFILQYAPLPSALRVADIEGTVWQGSAQQVQWQGTNYGALNWQLNPLKMLAGSLEAQIRFGRGSDLSLQGRGVIGYDFSGLYAQNLIAAIPVEEMSKFTPRLPVPLDLKGQVEVNLRSYRYAQPYCDSAQGSLVWNTQAVSTPLADLYLGPVIAQFSCQQSRIDVQGEQQSKEVESSFSAEVGADRSYKMSGWFKPLAEFPQALQQQLKWLPEPADSDGKYHFNNQGQW
ncbi:type II secretion system protein N [Vibrio sp. TRT 1302]|uniref:type II secretion system protein N n=1 Tax=Vibrio sp. TRT 1302 TaxID=3418504 RepID=UPI003CF7B061